MPTRSRIDRRSDLLVGGLQLEKHGAKSVVAASDSHSRLADPIVVIERPRSVSQSENILVYSAPSSVAEAVRLSMSRIEHLPLFHHGAGLEAGHPVLERQILVESRAQHGNFHLLHDRLYFLSCIRRMARTEFRKTGSPPRVANTARSPHHCPEPVPHSVPPPTYRTATSLRFRSSGSPGQERLPRSRAREHFWSQPLLPSRQRSRRW